MRLFRPFRAADSYRALLFYGAELVLGVTGLTLLLAGWPVTLALVIITPVVVPLLIGLRAAVGGLTWAEAAAARRLIGATASPPVRSGGRGFWGRGTAVLRDRAFWKQQVHLAVSWLIALVPLALLSWAGELISLPIWYRWVDSNDVFGVFDVDSFGDSLPFAALGLVVLIVLFHLLGPLTKLSRRLANALLDGDGPAVVRSPDAARVGLRRGVTITALVSAAVVVLLVVIWSATSRGYFWPIWPLISLALVIGIPGAVLIALDQPGATRLAGGSTALAIQTGVSAVLVGFLVAVWAIAGGGYFWPLWPALGLAVALVVHAAVVYARTHHRIEVLEATRAGAVDVQETELRRIERDLHDGAQARLVAVGMSLGMAEQSLDTDPAAVRGLLAEARLGAAEALAELRDLARGIHPPILTDRGLGAALDALVARSPIEISLAVDVPERPVPAVETAAYFTVSEALANAIKHGRASRVEIRVHTHGNTLHAEVTDDGHGGADPVGRGLSGLRQRLAALDGTLSVSSPKGGPTIVSAEIPCGW
jgi:signal transduction histidine kinase